MALTEKMIYDAFGVGFGTDLLNITVIVRGTEVELSGRTPNPAIPKDLEAKAAAVAGVSKVTNLITIDSGGS